MIFDAETDFETLNEAFTTLNEEQQQIFVNLFFDLYIIGKNEWIERTLRSELASFSTLSRINFV